MTYICIIQNGDRILTIKNTRRMLIFLHDYKNKVIIKIAKNKIIKLKLLSYIEQYQESFFGFN